MPDNNLFLRHSIATLAYRCGKAIRNASPGFAHFETSSGSNTPIQILSHINDLIEWTQRMCQGDSTWQSVSPQDWSSEIGRFHRSLQDLDAWLASNDSVQRISNQLFQGPIADALTHTGQIAMLRRLAGEPIRGENYFLAGIHVGELSADQPTPVREF